MNPLLIFDLDGVITTESGYWNIARQGLTQILAPTSDPLPQDFIYWIKNHAINHNWDVAFVALTAAHEGIDEFQRTRDDLSGRALLESCPGYRDAPWQQVHEVCQKIQDASPLPSEGLHTPKETAHLFDTLAKTFDLAVATGRPRPEALAPLDHLGIRAHIPENRIITHLEVQQAERIAHIPLGKPHPFVVLRAIYPDKTLNEILNLQPEPRPNIWFIGDTASDISAARAAGVTPIGILTALPAGPYREQRRQTLSELGCATILDSVLDLPLALI
ncbi:MAG TPA: HAD family hydrolase [Bryobacteraceae bacterium]